MPDVYDDPTTVSAGRFGFPLDNSARSVQFSQQPRETGMVNESLASFRDERTMTLSPLSTSITETASNPTSCVVLANGQTTMVPLSREQAIAQGFTVLDPLGTPASQDTTTEVFSSRGNGAAIGRPGSLGPLTELIQADPVRPLMPADAVLAATLRAEQGAVAWPEVIRPVTRPSNVTIAHEPLDSGISQSLVDVGQLAIRDDSGWETHSPSVIDQRQIRNAGFSWPSELAFDRQLNDEPDDETVVDDMGFEPQEGSLLGLRPDLSEFDEATSAASVAYVSLDEHELLGIGIGTEIGAGSGVGSGWPLSIPVIEPAEVAASEEHVDAVVELAPVVAEVEIPELAVPELAVPELAVLPDSKLQDVLGSVLATLATPDRAQSAEPVFPAEPVASEAAVVEVVPPEVVPPEVVPRDSHLPLASDDPFVAFGQPLVRFDAALSVLEDPNDPLEQPVWAVLAPAPLVTGLSAGAAESPPVAIDVESPVVSWPVFDAPTDFADFAVESANVGEFGAAGETDANADIDIPVWPTLPDSVLPDSVLPDSVVHGDSKAEFVPSFPVLASPEVVAPQQRLEIVPSDLAPQQPPLQIPQLAPQRASQVASSSQVPAISIRSISRSYPSPVGDVRVLDDLDLDLAPGDLVVIQGASGSGISTLLHCLAGFDIVDSGHLFINGDEMGAWSETDRARFRAAASGFIPQNLDLVDDLNVRDNAALPLLAAGWAVAAAHDEAVRVLSDLGLEDRLYFFPSQLSRSERTRTVVGRALAGDPFVIWADDPTAGLDEEQSELVAVVLLTHHQRGATVVIGSRDPRFARAAGRNVSLSNGRLVPVEAPALRWGS
jgi:putative ABC transport system ATP-binding protein